MNGIKNIEGTDSYKEFKMSRNAQDLTGQKFGRLTVIKPIGKNSWGNVVWLCKCDCGQDHIVCASKLKDGHSRSCGCLAREPHKIKHGYTIGKKPRTFIIWSGMKARCYDPKATSYKSYGKRGIRVCDEWLGENGFKNFHEWAMSHGYSDDCQLDRIDSDKNYSPENCQWLIRHENAIKQRKTRFFVINGEKLSIADWCRKLKIGRATAYKYLHQSEDAFIDFVKTKLVGIEVSV